MKLMSNDSRVSQPTLNGGRHYYQCSYEHRDKMKQLIFQVTKEKNTLHVPRRTSHAQFQAFFVKLCFKNSLVLMPKSSHGSGTRPRKILCANACLQASCQLQKAAKIYIHVPSRYHTDIVWHTLLQDGKVYTLERGIRPMIISSKYTLFTSQ